MQADLEQLQEKVHKLTKKNAELEELLRIKNTGGDVHAIPSTSTGVTSVNTSQSKGKLVDCTVCTCAKASEAHKMPASQKDSAEIIVLLQKLKNANSTQEKLKEVRITIINCLHY